MKCCASEHLGAAAGAGEGLWGLCRAWVLPRTAGGSDAPEPCLRWALRACSARAELGGEVHGGEVLVSEQIGVGAGAGEFENEHAFLDLVDEQPVGGDVAFAVIRPGTSERVVAVGGRQGFAVGKLGDDGLQLFDRQMTLDGLLVITLEGTGSVELVSHDSRSFQNSSRLVKCLRVGSLTMRSPSSMAAMVWALGTCGASMMKGMRRSRTMVLMYTLMTEEAESPTSSQKSLNCFLVGASSEKVMLAIVISPYVDSDSHVLYTNFTRIGKRAA